MPVSVLVSSVQNGPSIAQVPYDFMLYTQFNNFSVMLGLSGWCVFMFILPPAGKVWRVQDLIQQTVTE